MEKERDALFTPSWLPSNPLQGYMEREKDKEEGPIFPYPCLFLPPTGITGEGVWTLRISQEITPHPIFEYIRGAEGLIAHILPDDRRC